MKNIRVSCLLTLGLSILAVELSAVYAGTGALSVPDKICAALQLHESRMKDPLLYGQRLESFKKEYLALNTAGAFNRKSLAGYTDRVLSVAYEVVSMYEFYPHIPADTAGIENTFAELEKRRMVDNRAVTTLDEVFLSARKFDKSGLLRNLYQSYKFRPLPAVTMKGKGKAGIYVYGLDKTGGKLKPERINMKGPRIVVHADPGCYKCKRAFQYIEQDAGLREIFLKNALLLFPRNDFNAAREWNMRHASKIKFSDAIADWPGIDFSQAPCFYFYKDGKIVHAFSGWPPQGNFAELRRGLALLGL